MRFFNSILALVLVIGGIPASHAAWQQDSSGTEPKTEPDVKFFVEDDARIIHRRDGERPNSEFGWVARVIGDIDSDGVLDFVATAPSFDGGKGKIYVYSGKTAQLAFAVTGLRGERLGNGAAGAGDVDNDGLPDVIAGAPSGSRAYVYSGRDGQPLLELSGSGPRDQFGYKVAGAGDVDGDGHADVAVTALAGKGRQRGSGNCTVWSGQTGKRLFQIDGEKKGDKFGSAVCAITCDDQILLAIGAQDAGRGKGGKVYVYRIQNARPELAFEITGGQNSVNLGQMFLSFPGDTDRDGVPDVYVSDFSDTTGGRGAGRIAVHSGADGKELFSVAGKQLGEGFGTSPSEAGDVNGDGVGDLVVGAWQNRAGARSGGRVTLHDGTDGRQLDSWTSAIAGETLGFDAVGIGDVDGDGQIDFLLTSAWATIGGPKTGRVWIVAGKDYGNE